LSDEHYEFVVPILSGQLEAWKSMVNEMKTKRKKEYKSSRKKLGITRERTWLQQTPMGDFVVVHLEGKEPSKMIQRLTASKDPFDQWFSNQITMIHGLSGPPPTNELHLDIL
jgi:hypothetical protein